MTEYQLLKLLIRDFMLFMLIAPIVGLIASACFRAMWYILKGE